MRSSRGYLNSLVQSARPGPSVVVRSVHQPDWGRTRPAEPPEEVELDQPSATWTAHRAPIPSSRVAPHPAPRVAAETMEVPPPAEDHPAAEPRHPAIRPMVVARVGSLTPVQAPVQQAPVGVSAVPPPVTRIVLPAEATEPVRQHVAVRPVLLSASDVWPHASIPVPQPQLPAGTQAALERLEHLARRYSSVLPAEMAHPAPEGEAQAGRPATRERTEPPREPRPVVVAAPRTPGDEPPRAPRVEIGSIEIFVAQPAGPGPMAAPLPPVREAFAAPSALGRLSRPLHPYGFGQG